MPKPKKKKRKLPKAEGRFVDDLPELTPNQTRFVFEFMKDRNGTQAYLRVYGGKETSAAELASRMLKNVKVAPHIQAALARLAMKCEITAERNINRIAEIAYNDPFAGRYDVLRACELIGKTFGQFKDVVESKVNATIETVDKEKARAINEELESEC